MASKKASASAPVALPIAAASDGAVSGPVAMIAWSHSAGGRPCDLLADDRDQRMRFDLGRHGGGKTVAVDGERAAGRNLVAIAGPHDQRAGKPHLGMQQPDRIGLGVVGAEGVRADQLGKAVALVRLGAANGAHLVQHDRHASLGRLPRRFRAGEAAADDVDGIDAHGQRISPGEGQMQFEGRRCGEQSGWERQLLVRGPEQRALAELARETRRPTCGRPGP